MFALQAIPFHTRKFTNFHIKQQQKNTNLERNMGSETKSHKIPVVYLSEDLILSPGSSSWISACNGIRLGLEEFGVLEVVYDKYSEEFHKKVFGVLDELFKLPQETKMKNVNPKLGHGYMGKISAFPIHEGLGIENPISKEECEKFTSLMWPNGNNQFCETINSYAKIAAELEQLVVRMLFESYGIPIYDSESHINSSNYLLRLLRYRKADADSNIGFRPHSDKTFVTFLHQNHVNGLEARTKDGHWVPYYPSSPCSFVVIAGDVSMAWSNDRIQSSYHRVIINGEEIRYSLGLFVFLRGVIKPPEELVDDEHPLRYRPFEHQELLDFFASTNAENKREGSIMKAFCGI